MRFAIAVEKGLHVPLVYNCGGYERVSALKLLDGIVDIYMPDFKFWDPEAARELCNAPDYPERAREALREMHRQVGDLVLDEIGLAQRGLLVRHLVMPNGLAGTGGIVDFIATRISAQDLHQHYGPVPPLRKGLFEQGDQPQNHTGGVQTGVGCGLESRPHSSGRPAQALDNGGVIDGADG